MRPATPHTITLQPSSFRNLRLPKRLRVIYFLARTRLAQRLIMVPGTPPQGAALKPLLHFALALEAGDAPQALMPTLPFCPDRSGFWSDNPVYGRVAGVVRERSHHLPGVTQDRVLSEGTTGS